MFLTSFPAGPLQANCYLLSTDGKRCVVVDPGVNAFEPVQAIVTERDLAVEAVLLTHGHPDHVGAAADVADHVGVPAFIHAADRELFDTSLLMPWALEIIDRFHVNHVEPADLRELTGGEALELAGMAFTTEVAPGHRPGCLLWRTPLLEPVPQAPELTELVFTGDVVFAGSIGRTDLPGGDDDAMRRTLREVVLPLPDTAVLLPGHGPETTMAHERATNAYLQDSYLRPIQP
ncbi:MAG TPA: MBL fold metallo-hydrolase [Propionibacterium sp.]|nr:MBL fold metallo-hydrolase [Propionibacterium sp.]